MKKVLGIFIFCFFLISCNNTKLNNEKSVEDLDIILHAGGGMDGLTYLNAQETFLYYYNLGYRTFEYDLRLSTDGRLIGTHAFEHIDNDKYEYSYDEFKLLRLDNGFTPVNEEWLMETIIKYNDITIVVDAKMDSTVLDAKVLERLEELEGIYNVDISKNILPEVFSVEMWDIVKETTSFDRYFFSHYKVYYSIDFMIENFNNDRIYGIAIPNYSDRYIRSNLYRLKDLGKKIYVFTPLNYDEVIDCIDMGADGIYLNEVDILSGVNDEKNI